MRTVSLEIEFPEPVPATSAVSSIAPLMSLAPRKEPNLKLVAIFAGVMAGATTLLAVTSLVLVLGS